MMSNASNCPGLCTPARYYRITDLRVTMLAASTDVKFICYDGQFCNPT
jgi:hypothetical protein